MQTTTSNKPRIKVAGEPAIRVKSLLTGLKDVLAQYKCILFLDFDGVLHGFKNGHSGLLQHVIRIERILRDNPEICIVISTSWRFNQTMETMVGYFAEDVRHRFVGVTPEVQEKWPPYVKHERFKECQKFMEDNGYTGAWGAIDDSKSLFPEGHENVYITEGNIGMTDEDELKLVAQLKSAIAQANL
jgi:hypothetical protein